MTRHAQERSEYAFGLCDDVGCAPAVRKHQPGRLAPSTECDSEEGTVTIIVQDQRPVKTEARFQHTDAAETISRLRIALAASIADRASLVTRNSFLYQRSQPHWFVADESGLTCSACNTREANARHCERAK